MYYPYDGVVYHFKCGFLAARGFADKNDTRTHLVFPNSVKILENGQLKKVPVKEIDTGAFMDCQNLVEVVLPSQLEWIGHCAFAGCKNLERVLSRENNNVIHILGNAFIYCSQLKEVKLSTTVEISQKVFEDCVSLSTFDAKIWLASTNAFKNCKMLQKLSLAENVTLYNHSIEESGVTKLLFNGDVRQLPVGLSKWLKRKNVQLICVNNCPTICDLAYQGYNVCTV